MAKKSFEAANDAAILDLLLNSDNTLNAMGIGTAAVVAGFIGKVEAIRFDEVSGTGIKKRNDDQFLNIPGATEPIKLAGKDEYPASLFIIFEGGARKLAIPALFQHTESSITLVDGTEVRCNKMSGKQWKALIGQTLECTEASADETQMIPRPSRKASAEVGETEMRPARKYKFIVTA